MGLVCEGFTLGHTQHTSVRAGQVTDGEGSGERRTRTERVECGGLGE